MFKVYNFIHKINPKTPKNPTNSEYLYKADSGLSLNIKHWVLQKDQFGWAI